MGTAQDTNPMAKAVPALIEALKDPERNVRYRSVQALGELGADATVAAEPLVATLEDQDRCARWAAVEALAKIDPEAAPDAVSRATADRPTQANDKGDRLTLLNFDPPLPAALQYGELLKVRYSSSLAAERRSYIWAFAYTDGERTPGQGTGRSVGNESFVVFHSWAQVDQIRIIMSPDSSMKNPLVELSIDIDARWETAGANE